jgi:hypothetical protein
MLWSGLCTISGNWGDAQSAHRCGECIEGLNGGGGGADDVDVVEVCSDCLCRWVCGGESLEGTLECEGEEQVPKGVTLLHAAGGEYRRGVVGCSPEEDPGRPAVGPREKGQEGRGLGMNCPEDGRPGNPVEGVGAVEGEEEVIGVIVDGGTEGVTILPRLICRLQAGVVPGWDPGIRGPRAGRQGASRLRRWRWV